MSGVLDELAPDANQQPLIALQLADPNAIPQAHQPVTIAVDSSATLPDGLCLPLEVTVTGPSARSFLRKVDYRRVRTSFTFTPKEGGRHTVAMREIAHNLWWGSLDLEVQGDPFDPEP